MEMFQDEGWRESVTAWLRDMRKGQLWERGKDVQHIVFVLFEYSDMENSIDTLARKLCFLLPGQCIEHRGSQRRDIISSFVKHSGGMSCDACSAIGVLKVTSVTSVFASAKDYF